MKPLTLGAFGLNKGVWQLAKGAILVQIVPFLAAPLLSRLYSPAAFGTMATYCAIGGSVTLIASLRYEQAIPLPARRLDANRLVVLATRIGITLTIVSIAATWALHGTVVNFVGDPALDSLLYLLPVSICAGMFAQTGTMWLIRNEGFGILAYNRAGQSIGTALWQIGLGLVSAPGGLVWGLVVGQIQSAMMMWGRVCRTRMFALRFRVKESLLPIATRYRDFPTSSLVELLVGQLQTPLLLIFLTKTYSPTASGLYMLAQRLTLAPAALLVQSTSPVLFQQFASSVSNRQWIRQTLLRTWFRAAVLAFPTCALGLLAAHLLIPVMFPESWLAIIPIVDRLSALCVALVVFAPTSSLTVALRKQHLSLIWAALSLASKLLGSWLAPPDNYLWLITWCIATDVISMATLNLVVIQLLSGDELVACSKQSTTPPFD